MKSRTLFSVAAVLLLAGGFAVSAATLSDPSSNTKPAQAEPKDKAPAERASPQVGDVAPDWKLKDSKGNEYSLSKFTKEGKVVVMDFWGTWCPPCRAIMPDLQKIHEEYKDKGIVLIGMNWEHNADADSQKYMDDNNFTYLNVLKSDPVVREYGITGFPTLIVVGTDGKIAGRWVGGSPKNKTELRKSLDTLVAAKSGNAAPEGEGKTGGG